MDLDTSLNNYQKHLTQILTDPEVLYRFKCLSFYDSIGCFCEPTSRCHIDIIRSKIKRSN